MTAELLRELAAVIAAGGGIFATFVALAKVIWSDRRRQRTLDEVVAGAAESLYAAEQAMRRELRAEQARLEARLRDCEAERDRLVPCPRPDCPR